MSPSVYRFVALVVILGVAATAAAAMIGGVPAKTDWEYSAFVALIAALSSLLSYQHRVSGSTGSMAYVPLLAGVLLSPTVSVVSAAVASALLADIGYRRPLIKAVFNAAKGALEVAAALLVYLVLNGTRLDDQTGISVVAFGGAAVTYFLVNSSAVACVVSLAENRRFTQVWRKLASGTFVYDLFSLPAIYLFAVVYSRSGPGWALTLILPLLGLRQLYKQNSLLEKTNEELLQLMVAAIEARDPYTSGHSRRVARYAQAIGRLAGVSQRQLERLRVASLLHDVGKIYEMYAPILQKPDTLTLAERRLMETHTTKGAELAGRVSQLQDVVPVIRHHHERWDGGGYPDGLAGTDIPLFARVVGVADTIDAMTTERPYRRPMSPSEVRAELLRCSGAQFDPSLVQQATADHAWPKIAEVIKHTQGEMGVPIDDDITPTLRVISGKVAAGQAVQGGAVPRKVIKAGP